MNASTFLGVAVYLALGQVGAQPFHTSQLIFEADPDKHGHVHASCIVECPNGDLRAVWYENGPQLPPPHFSKERDKSDDVRIGGARKPKGAESWEEPFVMADTFGVSDNNPCMAIDRQGRLWLIHSTLIGVPERSWGSALPQYHVSSDYGQPGPPKWDRESILVVHPRGLDKAIMAPSKWREQKDAAPRADEEKRLKAVRKSLSDPFRCRLGWMSRAHPLVRSDGTLLVPLANENFGVAAMAMTSDGGRTWTISEAVPTVGVIQPTVVELDDGLLMAFFRNGYLPKRIVKSTSRDGGMTWSKLSFTDLPHPGSGIEAIVLSNGHLLMVYNDTTSGRDSLAVSISTDRGETWQFTRHLERKPKERFDYPSIIQAKDGSLHVTYSYNTSTIKYARFNEEWVRQGD